MGLLSKLFCSFTHKDYAKVSANFLARTLDTTPESCSLSPYTVGRSGGRCVSKPHILPRRYKWHARRDLNTSHLYNGS